MAMNLHTVQSLSGRELWPHVLDARAAWQGIPRSQGLPCTEQPVVETAKHNVTILIHVASLHHFLFEGGARALEGSRHVLLVQHGERCVWAGGRRKCDGIRR